MEAIQGLHVMTLANSIIGVSILAMPYCFKQCGIVLSIVLLLFSSVLSRLSCHFLIKSAIKAKLKTFENLAFHAFGPLGKFVVEIGLIGFLIGTCIAFFVVMGDLGPQIVSQLTETPATSQLRTLLLVALAVFCVLPLGLLKNVESLSGVCTATIGFYACLVLKIISESAPHIASGDWIGKVNFWRPSGILQCIPIFSMALFCQTQLFEIYQTMSNASLDKMNSVVRIATHMCTCVYIFVGVFGYIAVSAHGTYFGGNILLAFRSSLITEIIKIGFVLSVAFSFPLVIFPCRASIYSLLYKSSYSLLHDTSMSNGSSTSSSGSCPTMYIPETKFRLITFFIVLTSLLIGIIIPNIELVLGLVGSTIGVMICVIFPATCFICLTTKNTNERIGAQIMLCTGILVMVLGSYANLYAIEEVAINPMDAVKPIQIENIPIESDIKSFEAKHNVAETKLDKDIEEAVKEIKLEEINKNIPVEKANKGDAVQKPLELLEKEDLNGKEDLNEIRHEPVQPEEPVEEPKKEEEVPAVVELEKIKVEKVKEEVVEKSKNASAILRKDEATKQKVEEKLKPEGKIDDDAIKKEDAEVLEQKKKEILEDSKKNEEILENLQKQNELQQEIVEEQKKILGELKELKKIALEDTNKDAAQSQKQNVEFQREIKEKPVAPVQNQNVPKVNELAQKVNNGMVEESIINEVQNEPQTKKHVENNQAVPVVKPNEKIEIVDSKLEDDKAAKNVIAQRESDIPKLDLEPKVKQLREVAEEISGGPSKKPIQDLVLKLIENQMEENKRVNNSKEEVKIEAEAVGTIDKNNEGNINAKEQDIVDVKKIVVAENKKKDVKIDDNPVIIEEPVEKLNGIDGNLVKVKESDENVNAMRRDILSADESPRSKRDIHELSAANVEVENTIDIGLNEQCNKSSDIAPKDAKTLYQGKFLTRELKSVNNLPNNVEN